MEPAIFSLPKKEYTDPFRNLIMGVRSRISSITQDRYPVLPKKDEVPDWLILNKQFEIEVELPNVSGSSTGTSSAYDYMSREITFNSLPDLQMAQLEAFAEIGSEEAFVSIANAIDWSERSSDDFENAIRLALLVGAHLKARNLALEAVDYFPDNIELQKFSRMLAPPRVIKVDIPANPNLRANRDWLVTHANEYRGRWIALRGGELLASALSLKEIIDQVGDLKNREILVTQV
jgi:hypothetical protein